MTALHPARDRLILALDVDSTDRAVALARTLRPWFGVVKVGLQLFAATGPDVIAAVRAHGVDVFADLKLHDIPTTVREAARVVGGTGARFLTVHASGGVAVVRAAVEGFGLGAAAAGHAPPTTLAVTVLTSDADAGPDVFDERVRIALEARSPGVVCSALDVRRAKELAPAVLAVCPGVRPAGAAHEDQARVAEPGAAVLAGADLLVVGRPVTGAPDPAVAAAAVADDVLAALTRSGWQGAQGVAR